MGVLTAIVLILVLYMVTQPILTSFKRKHPWFSKKLMNNLYWYHTLFAIIYYLYAIATRSDSFAYYWRTKYHRTGWFSTFDTGTPFIDFFAYPFVNYFFFSYEMMMVLFAWFGYLGFVYFYVFFKEHLKFKHKFQGYDLLTLLMFLPNMHFWTASFGKGSLIFFGMGLVMYAISKMTKRKLLLILGLLLVYMIRPHVFLFMAVGIVFGVLTGREKIPLMHKLIIFSGSLVAIILLYDQILAFAKLDSDNFLESFDKFQTNRSFELAKAGSGLDTSNYPIPLKLFTFWFRPLFFDAPNLMGLIVSVENVFYLLLTAKLFQKGFFRFLKNSDTVVKMSLFIFLLASFALSGTLSNLGIIIRQKSMVMYFLLFVVIAFIDYKKREKLVRAERIRKQRELAQLQPG